jgi:hypothetical protein
MQSGPTSSNCAFRRNWVQTIFDFDQGNRTFDQLGDVRRNPPRLGRMYGVAALRRPTQRERLYLVPLRLAKILSDGRPLIQRAFIFSSL